MYIVVQHLRKKVTCTTFMYIAEKKLDNFEKKNNILKSNSGVIIF